MEKDWRRPFPEPQTPLLRVSSLATPLQRSQDLANASAEGQVGRWVGGQEGQVGRKGQEGAGGQEGRWAGGCIHAGNYQSDGGLKVFVFFFFYIVLFSKTVFTYFRESHELMTWGGAEGEGEFPADSPLHVELDVRLIPTTVRS